MQTKDSKEWRFGIVKRGPVRMLDRYGIPQTPYVVVENAVAAFTPDQRRVATGLTHDEACALCTILNAGQN